MKIKFRETNSLSEEELGGMFHIYTQSYKCTWDEFIEKKNTLDLYATYCDKGEIIGFTGLCYKKIEVDGKQYIAVYMGQTIIPASYRGNTLIQRTTFKLYFKHCLLHPFMKLVIWNNSLTYRPYLILARGQKDYYPHIGNYSSVHYKNIQNRLGEIYYPHYYNPETGVVNKGYNAMEAHEVNYTAQELADPDIKYYLKLNPGSSQGHGLISFSFGSMENIIFFLKKRLKKKYAFFDSAP